MEISQYVKFYPDAANPETVLIYSLLRGSVLQVSRDVVEALQSGTLTGDEQETMIRLGILVPDAAAERQQVVGFFDGINAKSNSYNILVALNLDCNLACPYCYEEHFLDNNHMNFKTADLLIESLLYGPMERGKEVHIDFYGGEPLLSVSTIRRIAIPLFASSVLSEIPFTFNVVTNGTLMTPAIIDKLVLVGLTGVKVTIDGPPDIHNAQRPLRSGLGSYDLIIENLKEVCSMVKVELGGNFTRDNYRRFPELLDNLVKEGIKPDMISMVQFSPVTPKAGEAGLSDFAMGCASPSEPWLIEASLYLREEILKRGWNTPKPKLGGCMVEFKNDMVVGWDGSLFKCPAFMGWPDLKIGSLYDDGIGDYRASHNMDAWKCTECLECAYLPLCFGGCRFLQRLRTGSIEGLDCRKKYLDESLERIVRQDIKPRKK
jgi:uncharacterized protein